MPPFEQSWIPGTHTHFLSEECRRILVYGLVCHFGRKKKEKKVTHSKDKLTLQQCLEQCQEYQSCHQIMQIEKHYVVQKERWRVLFWNLFFLCTNSSDESTTSDEYIYLRLIAKRRRRPGKLVSPLDKKVWKETLMLMMNPTSCSSNSSAKSSSWIQSLDSVFLCVLFVTAVLSWCGSSSCLWSCLSKRVSWDKEEANMKDGSTSSLL